VPGQIAGSTYDADVALRLALDRRLQEHDYLLARAARAEDSGNSPDLAAADAIVDEIAVLLAPSYGQDVASRITAPLHARNAALVRPDQDRSAIGAQLDVARADLDRRFTANPLVPRGIAAAELCRRPGATSRQSRRSRNRTGARSIRPAFRPRTEPTLRRHAGAGDQRPLPQPFP
jgi:hypothetical protein